MLKSGAERRRGKGEEKICKLDVYEFNVVDISTIYEICFRTAGIAIISASGKSKYKSGGVKLHLRLLTDLLHLSEYQ